MKKYIVLFLSVLILPVILTGCNNTPEKTAADPGEDFELYLGRHAVITGEDLEISFTSMIDDSRCPKGAECIWAGEALCLIEVTHAGKTTEHELMQSGGESESETSISGYTFVFSINPYPEVDKEPVSADYFLRLNVTRTD